MPIDPSINLGYRPVQAPQPVNQFEAMVNAAKLKEYQSAQESKNALAAAYKGATNPETGEVDLNRLRSSLASGGLGAEIPGLEKTYYEGMGAKISALKAQAEFQLSRLRQARETIASFTTPEDAKVALDNSLANGEIDPNAYKSLVTRIPTDPTQMPAFQQSLLRENLTADQRLEQHLATIDSGGRTQMFATPKFAGGGGPQKILDITKTLTPGDIQQARDAAASRDLTRRGQNLTDAREREKIAIDAAKEKPLTESQAKAVTFASRMIKADKILKNLEKEGVTYAVPGVPNALKTSGTQKMLQARRDFINAVLRQESGAAISPSEFESAEKQYFPQFGDSKETLAQKQRNRETAIEGFKVGAGRGVSAIESITNNKPTVSGW